MKHTEQTKEQISKKMKEYWQSEEAKAKASEKAKKSYTDELKQVRANKMKELWSNPEFRAKMIEKRLQAKGNEEIKERRSQGIKKALLEHPDINKRRSESIKKTMSTDEYREKRSQLSKNMWDKEHRDNQSRYSKEWWDNVTPEKRSARASKIAKTTSNTSIERKVIEQLTKNNYEYQTQVSILGGRYFLDIVLPKENIAIECNGDYWHSLPDRVERDKRLEEDIKRTPYKLITLWEKEIKQKGFNVLDYL